MKKIRIKIVYSPIGGDTYTVLEMSNAAEVTGPRGEVVRVGSRIPSNSIDAFARDRRWECVIVVYK